MGKDKKEWSEANAGTKKTMKCVIAMILSCFLQTNRSVVTVFTHLRCMLEKNCKHYKIKMLMNLLKVGQKAGGETEHSSSNDPTEPPTDIAVFG